MSEWNINSDLKDAYAVEGTWGIREYDGDYTAWVHCPPDYIVVHKCPWTCKSNSSVLERWDMKTMHWDCPGCLTAPSERIVRLWKIMGGSSLNWENAVPDVQQDTGV